MPLDWSESISEYDQMDYKWAIEVVWALMWATGKFDSLQLLENPIPHLSVVGY